jgi:hypothetical protein
MMGFNFASLSADSLSQHLQSYQPTATVIYKELNIYIDTFVLVNFLCDYFVNIGEILLSKLVNHLVDKT